MIYIAHIIFHLVFIISFFNYSLFLIVFLNSLIEKSTDIYYYKIHYFSLEYIISLIYILIFFILTYILHLFNLNYEFNIKHFYDNLHRVWLINFSHINIVYKIYLLIFIFFIIFNFMLLSLTIHKRCSNSLYKLYLYHYHKDRKRSFIDKIHLSCALIGSQDIVTHLIGNFFHKLTSKVDQKRLLENTLPWYHFYKITNYIIYKNYHFVQLLIKLSPILVILYDIVFNNYLINHIYTYLIIYMPIIIFRRITTLCVQNAYYLCRFLFTLYYKQEKNRLYAISTTDKPILDLFLMSGLKSNLELIDTQYYLTSVMQFRLQHPERNTWMNDKGDYIHLTAEGRVFEELEEEVKLFDIETDEGLLAFKNSGQMFPTKIAYKLGVEWILICHKGDEKDKNDKLLSKKQDIIEEQDDKYGN